MVERSLLLTRYFSLLVQELLEGSPVSNSRWVGSTRVQFSATNSEVRDENRGQWIRLRTLSYQQVFVSAQATGGCFSADRCVLSPAHPARLWQSARCRSPHKHMSHAHPLQQPAGIRDGDGTEQPCPGGRDRLPVRPERRCCIAGTARHSPALPWGRPAESPAGSPALPCSALLLPQEPPARTHGGERSPVVRHASRRAEVIRNDRDPFHNSCNAVVTQPAVVMP